MSQEYRAFFHLGLPKVASTYLQKQVFPYLEGAQFYRKREFPRFKEVDSNQLTSHVIFSTEMDRGMEDTLDEVLELHPEARVILCVRSHEDWVWSRYRYHIRKHGHETFDEFIDLEQNRGLWKTEELLFSKKIDYIADHCKYNPLILNFDLLKKSPEAFIQKITDYIGCPLSSAANINVVRNASFSEKQLVLLRNFNRVYRYQEKRSSSRFLNKVHYKYRQFLLHIMAFLYRFVPQGWVKTALIDKSELARIRAFYKDDWDRCLAYADGKIVVEKPV